MRRIAGFCNQMYKMQGLGIDMSMRRMVIYLSYRARVVELADSLDSGSSVHYARAGSSPASRTINPEIIEISGFLLSNSLDNSIFPSFKSTKLRTRFFGRQKWGYFYA